jgi:predicted RNA-binding Zn-ribbon protein involved in translation (DUF1610 family)
MPSSKIQSYDSPYTPSTNPSHQHAARTTTTIMAVAVDDQDSNKPYIPQNNYHVPPENYSAVVAARVENPKYVDVGTRRPVHLSYCPNCAKQHVATHTRTIATGTTWVCVVVGVFVFWPLCWIPLVADPMKQTNHYCQNCGIKVGRVNSNNLVVSSREHYPHTMSYV